MKAHNVFIATLPRSGSTLLGMMLGAHSQVCHVGESAYWSKIDAHATKCCCGKTGCETLVKISEQISLFPNEIASIQKACGIIDMTEEPHKIRHPMSLSETTISEGLFGTTLEQCCIGIELIADTARKIYNKGIVVENSKYLTIADALLRRSTRWNTIIVTRDPRGIAFSSKNSGARKGVPRPVEDKIDLFLAFARRSAEISVLPNVLLVRYEDLCADTLGTLIRTCGFMGILYWPAKFGQV